MVEILKASEPVEITTVTALLYGDPGAGKTSIGSTAKDPLILDFDMGVQRSQYRCDAVRIEKWTDVEDLGRGDLEPYATIVVDTAGRCLDCMSLDIIEENAKMANPSGGLTLQGYGVLKARFAAWVRKLRSWGLDVIFIAHAEEKSKGDDLIIRPKMTGSSYDEVFALSDGVAYLRMVGEERVLEWNPREEAVGKNPAHLKAMKVPHLSQEPDFMADLMERIKSEIGKVSERGAKIKATVDEWRQRIKDNYNAQGLTGLVSSANEELEGPTQKQVKALISRAAKELNLTWKGDGFEAQG